MHHRYIRKSNWIVLPILACIAAVVGCSNYHSRNKTTAVPEILKRWVSRLD